MQRNLGLTLCLFMSIGTACATSKSSPTARQEPSVEQQLGSFLQQQTGLLQPLELASNLAWYQSSISGTDEHFAQSKAADDALNRYLADTKVFEQVNAFRQKEIKDPVLARQLQVLYLAMLGKQVDPALLESITSIEKELEQTFNAYRGKVRGKELTQNEINKILRSSRDGKQLQQAWEAQKAVGPLVADKLKELAVLRNQLAQKLGYRDFYALRLAESEIEEEQLLALFDQLDELTREPFLKAKAEVDKRLAKKLRIKPDKLMPWHYQNPFFQEPPEVFNTGFDAIYQKQDILALCSKYYSDMGLDVADIIKNSDLYEKPGKTPHAFAADIDRADDIRVLANIVPGAEWMSTMAHELGHASYDKYINRELPWLLRKASHAITTEGIAMMLERQVNNPHWLLAMGLIDAKARDKALPEAALRQAFASLQFSRWTQVMLRFERELYRDPAQDLNTLWWDLVEKYQGLHRPKGRNAPDYASKIHLVIVPVYYHNYMLGELFGAQVHEKLAELEGKPVNDSVYLGSPQIGAMLKEKIFAPGTSLRWDALTEQATGKPLAAEAFARRFSVQ